MRSLWFLAAALVAASGARAQPVTYAGALQSAQAGAPDLEARRLQIDTARATAQPASALPDPKLGLGLDNFPISGPPAGKFGADDMTMARVGLMQEVPNREKRRARGARAVADITVAIAASSVEVRDVRLATAQAWLDLFFGRKRLDAVEDLIHALAPLYAAAPSAVASGAQRPAEALEADTLRADLDDRHAELTAKLASARAQLTRWTGIAAPDAVGPAPQIEIDPALLRAALDGNPRLGALDARATQAQADIRLARAEKRPDWAWEVAYQRRDPMFGDMVSAGVTISLPIFGRTRQDPLIAAKVATAGAVRAQRESARRALQADLEGALADHAMHHEQFVRARDILLPLAKRRADLETASYAAGRASLGDVQQALTALANAQLSYLEREAQVATDAAQLTLTYGSDQ